MYSKEIPKGLYCYSWVEVPSKDNKYVGKVKYCPYYDKGFCIHEDNKNCEIMDSCKECGINDEDIEETL